MADEGCCGCGCGGCLGGIFVLIIWSAVAWLVITVLGVLLGLVLVAGLVALVRWALRRGNNNQPQPQENDMPTYCNISDRPRKR